MPVILPFPSELNEFGCRLISARLQFYQKGMLRMEVVLKTISFKSSMTAYFQFKQATQHCMIKVGD